MKTGVLRWDAGTAQGSGYSDGFLTVQPDFYGEGGSGGEGGVVQLPYGFLSRPLDPDEDGACQVLHAYEGDQLHVQPTTDKRVIDKLPRLPRGASIQFGADGGFGQFDPETHTWTLYIPTDFDGAGTPTKAHLFQIGKDANGKRCVTLLHADGPGLSILEGGKKSVVIKNAASNVYVEINDDEVVINGKSTFRGGIAEMVGANPLTAVPTPLARAPDLLTWAASLVATINALVTKVNALPPTSAIPPVPPLPPTVASGT